jgi:hypothetical protein
MVKPQCFMVQAMKSWPVGTKFLRGHDHEPQATAHLEKGWKPGGGPKFPDHQTLGELMSMALQSNPSGMLRMEYVKQHHLGPVLAQQLNTMWTLGCIHT